MKEASKEDPDHRDLARKFDMSERRRKPGRSRIMQDIRALIVRMALANPLWGYTRIMGALKNVGHVVSRGTISNVLAENGIVPAPERGQRTEWSEFLKAHWEVIAATDFFTVEVWRPRGLVTYYVLFVIELSTRKVAIAGITRNPNARFMPQVARELTGEGGFLGGKRFLLHDRDTKFTGEFVEILEDSGIRCKRLPVRSPNLNGAACHYILHFPDEFSRRVPRCAYLAKHLACRP